MTDYIAQVAELLRNGKDVIFYTVGTDTFLCIRELKARFGLLPTAVCDGDPQKQGRSWRGLEGLPVCSPDKAIAQYPETRWYIPTLNYRYQIIGYLTEKWGNLSRQNHQLYASAQVPFLPVFESVHPI